MLCFEDTRFAHNPGKSERENIASPFASAGDTGPHAPVTGSKTVTSLIATFAKSTSLCSMFITGLGTAVPPRRYTQRECWEALQASPQFTGLSIRSRSLVKKVLAAENGIASRHLAIDTLADAFDLSPDALHRRFASHAPALAASAARQA